MGTTQHTTNTSADNTSTSLHPSYQTHDGEAATCCDSSHTQHSPITASGQGGLPQAGERAAEWQFQDPWYWGNHARGGQERCEGVCWKQWGECRDGHGSSSET